MKTYPVVLSTLLLAILAAPCALADAVSDLRRADEQCKAGQYARAEQMCQSILQNEPNNSEAVYQAGKMLPGTYLATDQLPQAQEAVLQLLARCANHELLPQAVREIVEQAKVLSRVRSAGQIYRDILTAQPDHPQAVWLKMGVTIADACAGNDQAVEAGVADIVAHHGTDPRAAEALTQIGRAYETLDQPAKARPLYKYVVDNWPAKPRAIYAHAALIRGCIRLSDTQAARTQLTQLTSRYARDPRLGEVLNDISATYRQERMYEQAKPISQYVLDNCSGSDQCIWAQRDIILCDIGLRSQQAAQAGVEKLVKDCTQDGRLPYVLNDITRTYWQARLHEQARPISQYILDHYSGNDQCIWAQRDIILCDREQGNLEAAQVGLQKLIKDYADDGHLPYVLNEIAAQYRQAQMYEQSKAISQHVLDNYPDSDQRLWAQRDMILSDLASGNLESASAATQQLVNKFAKQPGVIWAVSEVAENYGRLGQHEQARNLFMSNLGSGFDPDDTIWSLRGFVDESVALNDDSSIDAGVKRLLSEYSASKNLPMAANHVAREVFRTGHPQASQLFQYVIDKYASDEQAIFARICMGHIYLQQGQDSQAEAIYQKILADYANHPKLAEAVSLMAEGYYEQAFRQPGSDEQRPGDPLSEYTKTHIQKALDKWDLVIGRLPPRADVTAMSCYCVATAYYQLGDYPKALQYCTQMIDRWPEHEQAWRAQMLIYKIYKRQMADGAIPEPQAMVAMTESFQQLLQKYPASPVASIARDWLQRYGTKSEGGER